MQEEKEIEKVFLEKENEELKLKVSYLENELTQIKRMLFGKKSERFVSSEETGMASLFDLPRQEIIIEPSEDTTGLQKIGDAITEIMEYKPGVVYVKRFVRPKYAKTNGDGVLIGELPSLPIPRGNAGASLLSHLMVSKYVDHLPFHRQKKQFKRLGLLLTE